MTAAVLRTSPPPRRRPAPAAGRRLLLLAAAALWVALALFAGRAAAQGAARAAAPTVDAHGVARLSQAWIAVSGAEQFPGVGPSPIRIDLPHAWPLDAPTGERALWYRLDFALPPGMASGAEGLTGVLLPRACGRLRVLVNDVLLFADTLGGGSAAAVRRCLHPRLIPIPSGVLRPAGNVLDLRLEARPLGDVTARQRAGGLSEVLVGPWGEMERRYEVQRAWQVASAQVAGLTLAVLGAFLAVMGWLNRRDPAFVYFGLLAVFWALGAYRTWWPLPAGHSAAEALLASIHAPAAAAAVLFLLRSVGVRHRRIDLVLLAQCVLMPLTLLVAGAGRAFVAASTWYVILTVEVAVAGAWCLREMQRSGQRDVAPVALLIAVAAAFVATEFAIQFGQLEAPGIPVGQFGVATLLIAVAFHLLRGFLEALKEAEAGRVQMQDRVTAVTAEIERNFAQLAELRVEQVTEKERKRIAADLHDDLGAKLLTIVHTSESERISTLAREALEEMRLSVRGLTGKPVRVADALADWRVETVGRLSQAGIEADWRSPTEDGEQRLAARTYVQTTRILREAVSNIIKHSGASFVKVRCAIGADDFVLVIQDNGKGISTEMSGKLDRGQGMYSMKNRAKQMQGQCLVESGPGYGTVIRLTLPLNEKTTGPAQA